MSGLLGSLQSARTGMSASQASIQTTSHNLNNMNTPGYSRQTVKQSARSAYSYPGYNSSLGAGQLGTGVEVTDIVRARNTFYDFQFRNESHTYGNIKVKYENYTNMETIFNEPSDTSISASINNFFASWQELAKNPKDNGSKDIVIQNSKYLADKISQINNKLENLGEQAQKQLGDKVNDINSAINQLRDLNKHIKIVEGSGKSPNDLLDERDRILDDLSFKLNIQDDEVKNLINDKIENGGEVTIGELKGMKNLSGEIKGSLEMIEKIDKYKNDVNTLAENIATTVNDTLKIDLFEYDGSKSPTLKVKDDIIDGTVDLDITSDKAQEMYKLKDKKVNIKGEDITINNFYNNIIQNLGNEAQEVIRNEKNQSKILKEVNNTRLNESGVALDEEMINLIQFQHAYNASAKVVSTIDSLLDVVINGLVR
ncbi:flagellar hook-associated protein FlgK [[Clostridium] dakarense]|uniref:flagellar hook-associated protein FlgK n=1 Tax=Faecalimicrobium dakarense TaxID=1301100 RepID=UPI0004BAEB0E|nr:flagellar hook-associated protein FlgK [[Clostridium] dakarense]